MGRWSRIIACAAAATWLAAGPGAAQEIVKFDSSASAERVKLRAELYRPHSGGLSPAVILLHGCSGWQSAVRYTLHSYAEDMQKLGFVVLNLDSFGPRYYSADEMCASNERLRQALAYRTSDVFDAARFLRGQAFVDSRRIFVVGQSNGGSVALNVVVAATQDEYVRRRGYPAIRGAVAYYPWCGLLPTKVRLAAPAQVFSGGRDDWASARECAGIEASGAAYQVTVYADAPHSFDLVVAHQKYAGFSIGHDPVAASDSRQRMTAFLNSQAAKADFAR
jgi:dienelactone hydrolase